jgi:hypothetical protein
MVARFDRDVISEQPDLVLWQVGTNVVLRDHPLGPEASLLRDGLGRLKAIGSGVVLIDPQFAPKVLAKSEITEMIDLIAATAKIGKVDLFHRFAIMRYWRLDAGIPFADFLSADQLHMNDWSYDCLAKLLSNSIVDAATRIESRPSSKTHSDGPTRPPMTLETVAPLSDDPFRQPARRGSMTDPANRRRSRRPRRACTTRRDTAVLPAAARYRTSTGGCHAFSLDRGSDHLHRRCNLFLGDR